MHDFDRCLVTIVALTLLGWVTIGLILAAAFRFLFHFMEHPF